MSMSEEATQVICPYCGHTQSDATRCEMCRGLFEPLSRQATQNAMGPWFIRDETQPFRPGCSYETLVRLVERGKVTPATIIRGPTTRQFWKRADQVQGLSHLMHVCHACGERVGKTDVCCEYCGAPFAADGDRQTLGLAPVRNVEAMAASKLSKTEVRGDEHLASVGYDRLRAAVEAAARAEGGDAARSALAEATDDESDDSGVPRQPRRRRILKEQLTPGQLAVERIRREKRQFMVKASLGAVTIFVAAVLLIWLLAWAGAISLPFALPGVHGAATSVSGPSPAGGPAESAGGTSPEASSDATAKVPPANGEAPGEANALDADQQQLLDLYAQGVRLVDGTTIAELERAVAIFIQVRDELPENLHPEDLPAQLRKAQQRLERLRLDEPPDG